MRLFDLSSAWRRLASRPGYTALSIGVLGLGLGAMLFLLAAVNSLILAPLPFPDAERLVAIGHLGDGNVGIDGMDADDYLRLTPELRSYDAIGSYEELTVNLTRASGPKRYDGAYLSEAMLPMLGVQPLLGRGFSVADDAPGAAPTLLLGERAWRDDFAADPAILGRTLRANGEPATVIGVMPAGFGFPFTAEVWVPRRMRAGDPTDAQIVARLKPDANLTQARAELEAVAQRLGDELAGQRAERHLALKPLALRFVDENTRGLLWSMFAAGALVALLACVNVANLQLSQVLARQRELAIRGALGAGRARLLRDLLLESFLLSMIAMLLALGVAHVGTHWLFDVLIANEDAPVYFARPGIDLRMVGFALVAALFTTLAAGLIPSLRASRPMLQDALRDGSKGSAGGGFARFVRVLVVAEVALTVVLLVGAGMYIRGLQNVLAFDFGTRADPEQILTARVGVFAEQFPQQDDAVRFFDAVVERLRADPQVESASVATALPGTMAGDMVPIGAYGGAMPEGGYTRALVGHSDDFFAETYGLQLLAGRYFDARDQPGSANVAVIDTRTAEQLWPGREALGQRLLVDPQIAQPMELQVVGVVAAMHLEDADDPVHPTVLVPLRQHSSRFATLAARTRGDAMAFAPRLAELVREQDADTPVYWVRTQARAIEMGRSGPVLLTQIFSGVGILALVLAGAGLYGVLAFAVAQRTREIGIRRAIGAGAPQVVRMVGTRIGWQVLIGLACGVALALPWSALLANPLMQTRAYDVTIFAAVTALVLAVALLAAFAPLRRALRVDPTVALRSE